VVNAYSKADNPRAAEQVFGEMKEAPHLAMLTSIMNAWVCQGNAEQAMRVFRQIPFPTTYTTLLSAHAKCDNAREAEALLRNMVTFDDENIHPNVVSFTSVLDCWSKSGEKGAVDHALSILSSLPEPDAFSYSCMMNACIKEGNLSKVKDLFGQTQSQGIAIDANLQVLLMTAYAKEGNAERTEELLDEMEHEGIANEVSNSDVMKA